MATVEVTFTPLPVHVRTARLVATAVARRSGVAESLLDEVRLAVGEACSRAVEAHLRHCPGQPIRVSLTDDGEQFEVVVTDAVPDAEHGVPAGAAAVTARAPSRRPARRGSRRSTSPSLDGEVPLRLPDGVGLAVIAGLADDVRIAPAGLGHQRHHELEAPQRAELAARYRRIRDSAARFTGPCPGSLDRAVVLRDAPSPGSRPRPASVVVILDFFHTSHCSHILSHESHCVT